MVYDAIIIGAGSAGLMCAVELEKYKLNYLLLEKNEQVGKKLLISGGSRCNVTNNQELETFINSLTLKNKKFLYPALYTFGPQQVIDFFKENGLELVLENDFKYFPITNKSSSVVSVLLNNINQNNILYNSNIKSIKYVENKYIILLDERKYVANNLVIATGSKSFPKTGSDGYGLKIAKQFGIEYIDFSPAETHIYSSEIVNKYQNLQGTSIKNTEVRIRNTKISYKGDVLFTHFGLSGPAIYHLSEFIDEYKAKEITFSITTKSEIELIDMFKNRNVYVLKVLEQCVTKRVAKKILDVLCIENKKIAELSNKDIHDIIKFLTEFRVKIDRVEAREKAYVNKGGILLKELKPDSMECKKIRGLHFIGETVNIHGPIGGYNITLAFATGVLAALNILESIGKKNE